MERLKSGASWLRADFHLHTNADKEFQHDKKEKPGVFAKRYVERLKEENIGVGLITNHNKLNYEEFRTIRDKAKKEGIFLLPGVELSVKDGAKGIHCLIAFNDNWFTNGHNYVEGFLNVAFEGIRNRENENTRCRFSLTDLLSKLDEYYNNGQDSLIIFAHIEDDNGFAKELKGGRIMELAAETLFRKYVLGLQKVRSWKLEQDIKQWFGKSSCPLPTFVEGSDCKKMEMVGRSHLERGKERTTYIKLGDHSFEAVKFALSNHHLRVRNNNRPTPTHAHLQSISFTGGKLDGKTLDFNVDLNCLIGTPGAGKSSVLETVRYILDFEFGDNAANKKYKQEVVENLLGSGGKSIAKVADRNGRIYTIERTLSEAPIIKNNRGEEVNMAINDGIISGLYFGQKDLSHITDNFNQSFLDKFIGASLKQIREQIGKQEKKLRKIIEQLDDLQKVKEEEEELKMQKVQLEEKIRFFDEYDLKKRLNRQEGFETDLDQMKRIENEISEELENFQSAINDFSSKLEKLKYYDSSENKETFEQTNKSISRIQTHLNEVEQRTEQIETKELSEIKKLNENLETRYNHEKEAFAEVRRNINADGNLKADDYLRYKRELKASNQRLKSVEEKLNQKANLDEKLSEALTELHSLHKEEANKYSKAIESINNEESEVSVKFTAHGHKEEFSKALTNFFQGTSIRKEYYKRIAETYENTADIYRDIFNNDSELAKTLSGGSQFLNFQVCFEKLKAELLTYQCPHYFELLYQDRPIQKYSVGERASALILFTLTMGDHDLIIIDQPEDDLNSQAIYKDVVETLLKSKNKRQFLFATHNPNIPVLGDCEQIICCRYFDNTLSYESGGIDSRANQQNIIRIMEGGPEAFQKRTEIYAGWGTHHMK